MSRTTMAISALVWVFTCVQFTHGKDIDRNGGKPKVKTVTLAELMLDRVVAVEFEARDITLLEACEQFDKLLKEHQGHFRDVFPKVGEVSIVVDKDSEIAKELIFLHVKKVTLKTILKIICEQNDLVYTIDGTTITVSHSGDH